MLIYQCPVPKEVYNDRERILHGTHFCSIITAVCAVYAQEIQTRSPKVSWPHTHYPGHLIVFQFVNVSITMNVLSDFQTEIIDQGATNGYGCQRVDVSTHWTSIFMPLKTDSGSDLGSDSTPSPTVPAVVDPVAPTSRNTPSPITPTGIFMVIHGDS